jgi:hypothetical protein
MYTPDPTAIIINSLRPSGRRRYTCAHELGHHLHEHGASFDAEGELIENRIEEFIANNFARALLMPKIAVVAAFTRRGWKSHSATAMQAFTVAQDLGVGFTTLLDQMSGSLALLDHTAASRLTKIRLPSLREQLVPGGVAHDVYPIDSEWGTRPLDVEMGDIVLLPKNARIDGPCFERDGQRVLAVRSGLGEIGIAKRKTPIRVRVSKREFVGRSLYRHLEDDDD